LGGISLLLDIDCLAFQVIDSLTLGGFGGLGIGTTGMCGNGNSSKPI